MKRLLSIELQKIWQNKASRILTIVYFLSLSLLATVALIEFDFGVFKFEAAKSGFFNFPYIWHFTTFIASWLKIFLAVIIVSMIANEYSYGTLKQNLIDGMSKKEFLLSKVYTILLFSFVSTILVFVISLILGLKYSSFTEIGIIFSDLEYLFAYFLKHVAFFSFCLFLALLIKRSAFTLGFIFVWFLGENIGHAILKYEILGYTHLDKDTIVIDWVKDILPLESMSNLIVEPFTRLNFIKSVTTSVGATIEKNYAVEPISIVIVLFWTCLFLLLSFYILKKRDL
ncbi:ABC transporter permease [Flavobacterium sp.]|jgi:ABC-type transport system involved in multi-copper enzyme maturation permease subunit|uniref:ABC transporter permease n=1 Tax=Flavobacterium sp. TaxID=239 RepID=UPI0037C0F1CB